MNDFIEIFRGWFGGGKYSIFLFPLFIAIILICSLKIVKYSLIIINKTKFGANSFSSIIIALVTSLPELVTEITQANSGYPQNGLGNDIGSNAFSTFLIAIGALIFIKKTLFLNHLSKWTKISIIISFFMSFTLTIFLIFVGKDLNLGIIGIMPLILFILYISSIYFSIKYDDEKLKNNHFDKSLISVQKAILLFVLFSFGILIFSILINVNLSAFQRDLNIKSDSIGGIMLALSTSLPEIIAFLALLKRREITMAITSLTGSHFFNFGIIFLGDLVYSKEPSFNKFEMNEQFPVVILNTLLISLIIFHFILANSLKLYRKNKFIYSFIPSIMIIGYMLGWTLILAYN